MRQTSFSLDAGKGRKLRYGENPHQKGYYVPTATDDPLAIHNLRQLQGKELSYNNYLDIDGVLYALAQIGATEPACVVVKHANPCGAAVANDIAAAYIRAWEGGPLAAFGGVIAVNRPVEEALAEEMLAKGRFFEILLAPSVADGALQLFARKPDLRLLVAEALSHPTQPSGPEVRRVRGGFLIQEPDVQILTAAQLTVVSDRQPTEKQVADMLFAWGICKVSKSNAIVLARDRMLVGSGVGQQDRKTSCLLAVTKAGDRARGAVAASDAFFPFSDGPAALIAAGVGTIIHPGGSIRDQETIDLCNRENVVLVATGLRCMRH